MIIVKLMGGLGNQMFQYALGRHLSLRHNTVLKLDRSFLLDRSPRPDFTCRDYDLDIFTINPAFAGYFDSLNGPARRYVRLFKRCVNHLGRNPLTIVREKAFHFDEGVLDTPDNCYFDGYWQSEKYFKAIEDTIRQDFTLDTVTDARLRDQILSTESVCLNVRRGDFVTNPVASRFHGVCNEEYFRRALDTMKKYIDRPTIFIFSDDIPWCRENLEFQDPTVFVTPEYYGKKYEKKFRLMSMCRHFIIPNSSFGWWAAWLADAPEKQVVAPRKWFADPGLNTDDLIPGTWIRI